MTKHQTFTDFCCEWPRLVGPQIAAIARPAAMDSTGVLHVRATTTAWRRELSEFSADILAALPTSLEGVIVRRIQWHGAA